MLWTKPAREIICPVCGANVLVRWDKNSQHQPKPYCDSCGWNVTRARKHFLAQVRRIIIMAALFAVCAWAVTDIKWTMLFIGGWMLIVMGVPIITHFRRLPPSRPAPSLQPLAGIADLGTVTLDTVTPRLNIILEALIVVASAIAILFLPRELDPARRRLSSTTRATICGIHDRVCRVPARHSRHSVLSSRAFDMVGTPPCETSDDRERPDHSEQLWNYQVRVSRLHKSFTAWSGPRLHKWG